MGTCDAAQASHARRAGAPATCRADLQLTSPADAFIGEAVGSDRAKDRLVLVVDDDPDILQTLALCLSTEGYNVLMAANGQEALDVLSREKPAVVLLDLMMPVMDGWEFARSLDPGARPPIIVLSADRNVSAKAKEIGALGWLAKPFELSELLAAVRSVVPVETP